MSEQTSSLEITYTGSVGKVTSFRVVGGKERRKQGETSRMILFAIFNSKTYLMLELIHPPSMRRESWLSRHSLSMGR